MGHSYQVTCDGCGRRFMVSEGGGFFFDQLHCDTCGREKGIGFDQLGEVRARYLSGMPGPYCLASEDSDRRIQEEHPGPPLTREEYQSEVEHVAGRCKCGGQYRFNTPPRCPKCRSTMFALREGGPSILYD